MAHDEQVSPDAGLNPRVVFVASQTVYRCLMLIHFRRADNNHDQRHCAKSKIRDEKNLCLLLEELFVVVETVNMFGWTFLPINEIVTLVKNQVKEL